MLFYDFELDPKTLTNLKWDLDLVLWGYLVCKQ